MRSIPILVACCSIALFSFAQPIKPVQRSSRPAPTTTVPITQKKILKPVVNQSYPASWLKPEMNPNWVVTAGSWLTDGLAGFLLSDPTVQPYLYSNRNIPIQSLVLYPLDVEDALDIEYITPVDLGYVSFNSPGDSSFHTFQIFMPANFKTTAWRMDKWPDGTISLLSLRYKAYLALEKGNDNKVFSKLIDSASLRDPIKVKFLLYGLSRTVRRRLSFYHPGTRSFLGLETNPDYLTWTTNLLDAGLHNTNKTAVKFIGTSGPQYSFDFGDVSGTANSLRGMAPGESFDMDNDGHNARDVNGDDCDDNDPNRFPGNPEKMDSTGHDENCICDFELVDRDHDGHYDFNSFNRCDDGTIVRGDDCDDNNPAIVPGALIFINDNEAELCGTGRIHAETGKKFLRQPNGLATLVLIN